MWRNFFTQTFLDTKSFLELRKIVLQTILCLYFFFSSSELISSCTLTKRFWLLIIFCSSLSLSSKWACAVFNCSFVELAIFKWALSVGYMVSTTEEKKTWWFSNDSTVGKPALQASGDKIESITDSKILNVSIWDDRCANNIDSIHPKLIIFIYFIPYDGVWN